MHLNIQFSFKKSRKTTIPAKWSQTQSDSRAVGDSKKGLEGRIEISEKNYLQIFS